MHLLYNLLSGFSCPVCILVRESFQKKMPCCKGLGITTHILLILTFKLLITKVSFIVFNHYRKVASTNIITLFNSKLCSDKLLLIV